MKYVFKPYSPLFPQLFADEKLRIMAHLPPNATIEHVGSTAVPNLGGKGIIDIAVAVDLENFSAVTETLKTLGYEFRSHLGAEDWRYFVIFLPDPEEETRRYHLHLICATSKRWNDLLRFRDLLRNHPELLKEYACLKKEAASAAAENGEKYRKAKSSIFEKCNHFTKPPA